MLDYLVTFDNVNKCVVLDLGTLISSFLCSENYSAFQENDLTPVKHLEMCLYCIDQ